MDQKSEPAREPPAASEKSKTVERAHEPDSEPPPHESPSHGAEDLESSESDRVSVVVVENVVNVVEKDVHRHTHYHIESPRKPSRKTATVRIEVYQKPQRSERCERLMREHLERVRAWDHGED